MARIIILAAGKGTRMNSDLPKVLVELHDRPMIKYLMDSVKESGVDPKPLVVVSPFSRELVKRELRDYSAGYVTQAEQLGTGHAVSCARAAIQGESPEAENIIVLYGDHPFLSPESIRKFAELRPDALTIMPTKLPDFEGWRHNFYHWGRIIRGRKGRVEAIREFKDASEDEKRVTEVNPGFMCFNTKWLFDNIGRLRSENSQKEYYLTDLVYLAFEGGHEVGTLNIEPSEAMGINSPEELNIAEKLVLSDEVGFIPSLLKKRKIR